MKKAYIIPETMVKKSLLLNCVMLDISGEEASSGGNESKERYEEEEKGFGSYEW